MFVVKRQKVAAPAAKAPEAKKDDNFYCGIQHPLAGEISDLLAQVASGAITDIAGAMKKAQEMIESPAVWLGIGTTFFGPLGQRLPYTDREGVPTLNPESLMVYTMDPKRELVGDEKKGALLKTWGSKNQPTGAFTSHPDWETFVQGYRASIGVKTPETAKGGTQIPAGRVAVPAGDEEVISRPAE